MDMLGKKQFQIGEKYYFEDLGIRNAIRSFRVTDIGQVLENVVCHHLLVCGYTLCIGRDRDKEVDFVAIRREEKVYIQVTYQLGSQATIDREFAPLMAIDDHYPKYVVSMDELWQDNIEGVKHRHIADFLLDEW